MCYVSACQHICATATVADFLASIFSAATTSHLQLDISLVKREIVKNIVSIFYAKFL